MCEQVPQVAVLIPCHNEENTIGKVISDFARALPDAAIVVFDNCSTDATAKVARAHGAEVLHEPRLGKGFVVESMFASVRADAYVMVDGDDTYPADRVGDLLSPVLAGKADMVVGARLQEHDHRSFPPLHFLGNSLVRYLVNRLSGASLTDIMSGYRAFSRKVVQRLPVVSSGFEIETEMTVQALHHNLKLLECPIRYRARPIGSTSKLRTFRDGFRVLWKIFSLFRCIRPLAFFGTLSLLMLALGLLAGIPPVHDYITDPNHYVHHVPLAILATGLVLLSAGCAFLGIMLHAVNVRFSELHNVLTRRH